MDSARNPQMNIPSDLPINVLPAEGVLNPNHLHQLQQLFGADAKFVVLGALHESIIRSLQLTDLPADMPAQSQPRVVGVVAGAFSGNLVAAAFRRQEALADFIAGNPVLRDA